MSLIWATRGRTWGFKFIHNGGFSDPLPEYDRAFSSDSNEPQVYRRIGGKVALRFPDPLERKDAAGRVIPHEFIVSGPMASQIDSVESGIKVVWPVVANHFEKIWELPGPHAIS